MPIIVPGGCGDNRFYANLQRAGVPLIGEAAASQQVVRPARIGLMNLMPEMAMEPTEIQWLRWIGSETILQINPVLIKFDDDRREASGRKDILRRYTPFSEVVDAGLDGLIITGDNLELRRHARSFAANPDEALPETEIDYYRQLTQLFDWADNNVHSTIFSCLAAHFKLKHTYDITKDVRTKEQGKIFGVYEHQVIDLGSKLVPGMDDVIRAPHSRWGDVPVEKILAEKALNLVAANDGIGWLFVESQNSAGGMDVLVQAHPEYDRLDLHAEYKRDVADNPELAVPLGYYKRNLPDQENVQYNCISSGFVFHRNWLGGIVYPGFAQAA